MRVAITGGTGFVGSHTVKAVLEAGHTVRLLVRSPAKVAAALEPLGIDPTTVDVAVADITDRSAVAAALTGMDAVIHAASVYTLDPNRAREVAETNDAGIRNVVELAIAAELDPIVHVSSVVALIRSDGHRDVLTADSPVGDSPMTYPASKARQEAYVRRLQADGHPVVVTHPGGVYGPHDPYDGESQSIVRGIIRGLFTFVPPMTIPIVDVRDLAAVHAAVLQPGMGPRRFMAGGTAVDGPTIVSLVTEANGRRRRAFTVPLAMARPAGVIGDLFRRRGVDLGVGREGIWIGSRQVDVDNSATVDALGVSFRPVEETLADQVRWMKADGRL